MIDKKRQNNANREKETWLRRPVTIIEHIDLKMIFKKAPYVHHHHQHSSPFCLHQKTTLQKSER